MVQYFRDLFAYEYWANKRIISYLLKHNQDKKHDKKMQVIFGHPVADMKPWIYLLKGDEVPTSINCQPDWPLHQCQSEMELTFEDLFDILENITSDDELEQSVQSLGQEGKRFRNTLKEIFTHMASHSQYHRGQIEMLIEEEKLEYFPTTYMSFLRI